MVSKSLFTRPIVVWMLALVTLMCACSAVMAASAPSLGRAVMAPSAPSLGRVPIIPIPKDKLDQWSCAKQYRIIGNNKALFNLTMKQHLSEADRLLLSQDIKDKRRGLGIALAVALAASDTNLNNGATAANICDRYLIPKQALGLSANWECLSKESILTKAVAIYEKAGQSGKVVSTGKMWLRYNSTGNSADAIRVKMASALIKQGKRTEAASYLKEISDTSSLAGAKTWIPAVGVNTKAAIAARDGAGLVEAFTNMADASLADIQEEASREATGSCTKYSNVPVAVPFSEKFGGGFTPYSNDSQLAVCSDAPAKVYVDGELVLNVAGKPGTAYVVPIKWKMDKLYGIDIEYSKSSRTGSAVGGATMFAYNGGGELSVPLMLCEASGSAGTITITSKIQITGGGPCILSAELITQEITDAHTTTEVSRDTVTPYAENGYWVAKFNWNTCDGDHNTTNPVTHNGNYTTNVIWRNIIDPHNPIVILTDPGTATVNNLVITSVSPDLVSWPGGTTSTSVTANYTDGDTPAKTALLSAPNVVSGRNSASTSAQGTPSGTSCSFNLTGAQNSKELYTCQATVSHDNDSTTYRSAYLAVSGVSVSYVSHDDNGTPNDPSDDKENYTVSYTLADTKGRSASEGELRLYNPNESLVSTRTLTGSELGTSGHNIQVSIPDSSLQTAGEYTYVVHVKDGDSVEYRDHQSKWAQEVGGTFQRPKVTFVEDINQKYGFDAYTSATQRWKSVRIGDNDNVIAEIDPSSAATNVYFKSSDTSKVTVPAGPATGSPYTLTLAGVTGGSKGYSFIQGNVSSVNGYTAGSMCAFVYHTLIKRVAIRLVHQGNDDMQAVAVGSGKPGCDCVSTGANGICNTGVSGDDVQLIPQNQGKPNSMAITAGTNGILDTSPLGDDAQAGQAITTGANGICNTTAAGDDVQVIGVGNGAPNQPAIDTGANGICNTTASGDDGQVVVKDKGAPNEICIAPGTNALRDTVPVGDDSIDGESVDTGADGICESSTATATSYQSTDGSEEAIRDYLNNHVYNQAVCCWIVERLPAMTVNFDLNRNSKFDINEMNALYSRCEDNSFDANVFFVNNPAQVDAFGVSGLWSKRSIVFGNTSPSIPTTTAHELGHSVFGLDDNPRNYLGEYVLENIMTQGAQTKWRLFIWQWQAIQTDNY